MKPATVIQRQPLAEEFILDSAITSPWVNFVHPDGYFETNVSVKTTMSSIDRKTHHLVQVSPGKSGDELDESDPLRLPTCRVMSKIDLRAKQESKLDAVRKQAKGMAVKIIELNWAIAPRDLEHRMKQMQGFLMDGKKVEVMLGPKKGGRKASVDEANAVLKVVRDAVDGCNGSKEARSDGEVGELMKLTVQGKEIEKAKRKKGENEAEGGDADRNNVDVEPEREAR